jgi:hypothetical protein
MPISWLWGWEFWGLSRRPLNWRSMSIRLPLFVFQRVFQAALPVIGAGSKVLVHCMARIHRSAAMAC